MRFVDYHAAEVHCLELAKKLRSQLKEKLSNAVFIPIPRGGLIVLGILSYILQLRQQQIRSPNAANNVPLVVVIDDCCLSGGRFSAIIDRLSNCEVIFAHLFSHPKLRQAILHSEPKVQACIAAEDLREREDFIPPDTDYWDKWRNRLAGKRYWLGALEPIAFSWSEPDRVLWNPFTEQVEGTWHEAPPTMCLDSRTALGLPLLHHTPGGFVPPAGVLWKVTEGKVTLWRPKTGRFFEADEIGGIMWRALILYGDPDIAIQYITGHFDVTKETVARDLQTFIDILVEKGLLETGSGNGNKR